MTPYSQHVGSKQNEPPFKTSGSSSSFGTGVLLSVGLHAVLVGFVIFGLPIFWQPEQLPGAIGIELAQLSDITAAPKVQKEGKPNNKPPEPQQEVKKEEPKKETPPPPPNPPAAAAPPPPAAEPEPEVAEVIPDPEVEKKKEEEKKKKEQRKKEEEKKKKEAEKKKKEEEKKKQQKKDDEALETMLANVLDQKPAPEPEEKPAKKADAKPAEPSAGPQTENISEIPMTASEEEGIRAQIEGNWNKSSFAGAPNIENMVVELRITLQPDGTVLKAVVLNNDPNPFFRAAADSAARAVMISSPLKLPPGKSWDTIKLRFFPGQG